MSNACSNAKLFGFIVFIVVVRVIHLCIYLFCRIELAFNIAFNMLKRKDALFVWLL